MLDWAMLELAQLQPFLVHLSKPQNVYLILVFLAGLGALIALRTVVNRSERKIVRRIGKLKGFNAVTTETPLDDPLKETKARSIDNIHTRFSIIRRLILPTLVAFWLLFLTLPFLHLLPAAVLSLVIGTATIVIGIAARPFIENLISGLVISFTRPIRIGDTVLIDGHYGTVEDITLTFTIIKVWDWRRFIVPNHRMLQKEILNYSLMDSHVWANVKFSVSPDADLDRVEELAKEATKSSSAFRDYEEPSFWVIEINSDSVECWVAGWSDSPAGAWQLGHEARSALLRAFRREKIGLQLQRHTVEPSTSPPLQAVS